MSETRRKHADARVISFLSATTSSALYVSVLSLGELRKGVALKSKSDPDTARKIASWIDGLEFSFMDRIVGIDAATARLWGELSAQRSRPVIDTLLAATAIVHNLTFVTRNTSDITDIELQMLDPWKERRRAT